MKIQSAYSQAPDLLTDQIAVITGISDEIKAKRGENDYSKKFDRTLEIMVFVLQYMKDLDEIYHKASHVSTMNTWLMAENEKLHARLQVYEMIEAQILSGELTSTIETVNKALEKKLVEFTQVESLDCKNDCHCKQKATLPVVS
ncbi:MAG: hypothetical protein WCO02_18550 [Bacteroidota bacterium]